MMPLAKSHQIFCQHRYQAREGFVFKEVAQVCSKL
jgi:hypothetical protein